MASNLVYKNGDATTALDAAVWGPHYWFVLFSMAVTYPERPNDVTIKKYYDFIQNLPLFLPNHQMGNAFSELLDKYPVSPYLGQTRIVHQMGAFSAQSNQPAFESRRSVAAGCRERVLFKLQAQRGASARRDQIPSQIDLCHGRSRSCNLPVLHVLCMKLTWVCGMPCNKYI